MVVAVAVNDAGVELVEIAPLDRLQGIRDPVQLTVLRRIAPNLAGCGPSIAIAPLEAGPPMALSSLYEWANIIVRRFGLRLFRPRDKRSMCLCEERRD